MKVKDFKKLLNKLPDNQEVYIVTSYDDAFPASICLTNEIGSASEGKLIPYIRVDNTTEHRNFYTNFIVNDV